MIESVRGWDQHVEKASHKPFRVLMIWCCGAAVANGITRVQRLKMKQKKYESRFTRNK